jgi:hypothetical protein
MAMILAGTLLIAGMVFAGHSRPAYAKADYAQKTGKPCTTCHTPAPPNLNSVGKRYKAKGHKFWELGRTKPG